MNLKKTALRKILFASQAGQAQLRRILKTGTGAGLGRLLRAQRTELENLELDIRELACQRGLQLPDTDPALLHLLGSTVLLGLPKLFRDERIAQRVFLFHRRSLNRESPASDTDAGVALLQLRLQDLRRDHMRQLQLFLGGTDSPASRFQ